MNTKTDSQSVSPTDPNKTYGLMGLVKGTTPMVEKGQEDALFSWPHLLIMEVLTVLGTTLVLLIMSVFINAPLREIANPDITENPAKAPWYFLNLQELLLHMDPSLAGVILPTALLVALLALPFIDRSQEDVGRWFASQRGKAIALWAAIYTAIALVGLILFDEFVRVRSLVSEPEVIPGWIIPLVIIGVLMGFLYLSLRPWRPSTREVSIALFTGFAVTFLVLTIVGTFFRGLGMHLTWPWELPPGGLTF